MLTVKPSVGDLFYISAHDNDSSLGDVFCSEIVVQSFAIVVYVRAYMSSFLISAVDETGKVSEYFLTYYDDDVTIIPRMEKQ